jgi:aryl-alcohol dehydrogenase-like predicted oxidoreductase
MEYRKLGRTGLRVSPLCMGTMQFGWSVGEADSHRIMSAAFEAGINFFDTADVYSRWVEGNPGGVSESYIGTWMKQNNIRPGTPEWFKLWFSLPYLTGEKPR